MRIYYTFPTDAFDFVRLVKEFKSNMVPDMDNFGARNLKEWVNHLSAPIT